MELEAPAPVPPKAPEVESSSRRRTRQSANPAPVVQAPKGNSSAPLDNRTKNLFSILLSFYNESKATTKKNNVDVKVFWKHLQDNYPNPKFPDLRFESELQYFKILEGLVNTSKIVLDEDAIFII